MLYVELADIYEETLHRIDICGLRLTPDKIVICPQETTLFGWRLAGTEWKPTAHTTSALAMAKPPSTVKGLRNFISSFQQFADCVPRYAETLHDLEQLVGGRSSAERIQWTDVNLQAFEGAKSAAADVHGVYIPLPQDQLHTFSDYSEDGRAVGGRLEIIRRVDGQETTLLGGYFSVVLDEFKQHWAPCEAEAAGVRLVLHHFEAFIRENQNVTVHFTDNMPTVQAWKRLQQGKFSSSSRISTFLINLSSMSVEVRYRPGKLMASTDYTSRHPVPCEKVVKCQICAYAKQLQDTGDGAARIRSLDTDELDTSIGMPYTQLRFWRGIQFNDWAHSNLRRLILTEQYPTTKRTTEDYAELKGLHEKYLSGDLQIRADGLIMIKTQGGYFDGYSVSVPSTIFPGVAFVLHVKLGHLRGEHLSNLMARYFSSHGAGRKIQNAVDNCVCCRNKKKVPGSTREIEILKHKPITKTTSRRHGQVNQAVRRPPIKVQKQ